VDFDLTDTQLAVRSLAADVFGRHADPARLAEVEAGPGRFDRKLWQQLAVSGVLGLTVPEDHGGGGLDLSAFVLALIEQGRRVPLVPLWETVILGALPVARFGSEKQQARWLPPVADGSAVLTAALEPGTVRASSVRAERRSAPGATGAPAGGGPAWSLTGSCRAVPAAHLAAAVVVPATLDDGARRLFLVETGQPGVAWQSFERTDRALAADLTLAGAAAEPLPGPAAVSPVTTGPAATGPGTDPCEWLRQRAWVGLAALQLGVSQESVSRVAAYTSERHQFGVPLATFQAVAHQAANCYIDTQAMEVTFWDAVWRLETGRPAAAAVHVARWWAADAGDRVARVVQHLHGGLGADVTYPIHRYFLWSSQLANTLGSASWHLDQIGEEIA
jgi:3-oxocholest-4-en-26-oyl-CoA dehydrogenase beta subunit